MINTIEVTTVFYSEDQDDLQRKKKKKLHDTILDDVELDKSKKKDKKAKKEKIETVVTELKTEKHLRRSYSELFSSKRMTKHKKTQSEEDLFPSLTVAAIKDDSSSTDEEEVTEDEKPQLSRKSSTRKKKNDSKSQTEESSEEKKKKKNPHIEVTDHDKTKSNRSSTERKSKKPTSLRSSKDPDVEPDASPSHDSPLHSSRDFPLDKQHKKSKKEEKKARRTNSKLSDDGTEETTRRKNSDDKRKEKKIEDMAELEPISLLKSSPKSDSPIDSPTISSKFGRRPSLPKGESLSPRLSRKSSKSNMEDDSKITRKPSKRSLKKKDEEEEVHEIPETLVKEAIFSAQTQFFFDMDIYLVYCTLLKNLVNLTSSTYGFMGSIKFKNDKMHSIRVHAIMNKTSSSPSKEVKISHAKLNNFNTLCGSVVLTKHFVLSNLPNEDPRGPPGVPKNHPSLESLLVLPLLSGSKEEVLAIIAVCNRPGGFTERQVLDIQPYIKTCGNLLEAYYNHQTIQQQRVVTNKLRKKKLEKLEDDSGERKRSLSVDDEPSSDPMTPKKDPPSLLFPERRPRSISATFWSNLSLLSPKKKPAKNSPPTSPKSISRLNSTSKIEVTHVPTPSQSLPPSPRTGHMSSSFVDYSYKSNKPPKVKTLVDGIQDFIDQKDSKTLKKRLKIKKNVEHINDMTISGRSLLHHAIMREDTEAIDLLIEFGAEINIKDAKGGTPLHLAAEIGNGLILLKLLENPAIEPNAMNSTGSTAFHYFCGHHSQPSGIRRIFEAFLSRKIDINAQDTVNGETPLHKAILNPSVRLLIVKLLLEHNADPNVPNTKGDTALHYAVRLNRKDLVFELLGANADIYKKNRQDKTPMDVAIEDGCNEQIVKRIADTGELIDWFRRIDMQQYASFFVKENIFIDVLHLLDEKTLIDMGITALGDRMRILNQCADLKQRRADSGRNSNAQFSPTTTSMIAMAAQSHSAGPTSIMSAAIPQEAPIMNKTVTTVPSSERARPTRQRPQRRQIPNIPTPLPPETIKTNLASIPANWIPYNQIEFTEQLGGGASGQVYKGYYNNQEVAIKVFETKFSEFEHEFKIISSIQGPHVINFFGATLEPRLCLVMELCTRGSLYDILNDPSVHIGWKQVFGFAQQMVRGLQILHNAQPQVLHRDVKSMNFLVDKDWLVKVCDFGSARSLQSSNMSTLHKLRGTMIYCSPEVCKGEKYTDKSDIYSLAICLWELVNRCMKGFYEKPYAENKFESSIQIVVLTPKGLRPKLPEKTPNAVMELLNLCWENDGNVRPNCEELLEKLQVVEKDWIENNGMYMEAELRRPSIGESPELTLHQQR